MSDIHESIMVDVPFERVPELAERHLASLRGAGRDAIVPLSLTVGDISFQRLARISIVPNRRYWGYEVLDIRWEACADGPYPAFKGTLCAEEETTMSCRLDLDGSYVPPGSIAGIAFDAMVGNAIARAVAQNLLQSLKTAFEDDYRQRSLVPSGRAQS